MLSIQIVAAIIVKRDLLEKREEDTCDCRMDKKDEDERGGYEARTECTDRYSGADSPE